MQSDDEWRAFRREGLDESPLADDTRFATNDARVANRSELVALSAGRIGARRVQDALERLRRANIAVGSLRTAGELLDHPAITPRGRRVIIDSPVGPLEVLRPPIDWAGRAPRIGAIPALGQHTDAVLAEFDLVLPPDPDVLVA